MTRSVCARFVITFTVLLGALLDGSPARAGGFHITILGVRRTGMMTNLANPDDVTALFHNPAGLADLPGTRMHLSSGITLLGNNTELQALDPKRFPEVNTPSCGEPGKKACSFPIGDDGYYTANFEPEDYLGLIPYLGISQDLGFISERLKGLVASFAAYAPGAYGASLAADAPTSYFVIDGLFLVAAATVGVGWRINDIVAVGANLSYNYMRLGYSQKFSTIDVLTPKDQDPDAIAVAAQQRIGDLRLDYTGTDHGFGWGVGVLVTPLSWLAVGATYTGATSAQFEGGIELGPVGSSTRIVAPISNEEFKQVISGFNYKLPHSLVVEMPIPPSFNLGVSFFPSKWVEVGLDFRLWLYTIFEKQKLVPIYDPAERGTEPMTEQSLSKDKNYSNSFEVAAGVLVRPLGGKPALELMGGVSFDKSPVPDETFSIDNPSMNQLIFSLGVRGMIGEHWRLGAAYMMINYLGRDVRTSQTSPPTNVRISGRSHIPTLEAEYLW